MSVVSACAADEHDGLALPCERVADRGDGRIAHELSPERSSYGERGSFITQEKVAELFAPPKT
jgi:hypothetical protein